MSVELLEEDDGVLVSANDAASSASPATSASPVDVSISAAASAASSSAADARREAARERVKQVIRAEEATDEPSARPGGRLDESAIKLPHLPSPFDSVHPRSRGGDRWKGITPDGHCMVCGLEPGDGKGAVPVLTRVYLNVECRLADGTLVLDFPVEELDFTLGQAQVPKGLEMAVCQMEVGQRALVRCCADYGWSQTRRPANVPADATLFFDVRVLRWEKEKNLHEMSLEDKWAYCQSRREMGKTLFSTGKKPRSAIKQYEKALTVLDSIQNHEVPPSVVEKKNDLLVLFWVNQAQCWTKVPDLSRVLELCNRALKLHPKHAKALFRRGEARKAREEWDEAERDFQRLVDLHAEQQNAEAQKSVPERERVDEAVVGVCRAALLSISTRRSRQSSQQRKRMDGFMKRASEGLYEDMPMVSATTEKEPEEDYDWLNKHAQKGPGIMERVQTAFTGLYAFVRSFCGRKAAAAETKKEQ